MAKHKGKKDHKGDKGKKDGGNDKRFKDGSPYDPHTTLRGKQVKQLARSLTRLTTKPQIGAARSQAKSLNKLLKYSLKSNQALTNQASSDTSEYYKRLAGSDAKNEAYQQALAGRLSGSVAAGNTQAQGNIQAAGQSATQALSADQDVRRVGGSTARDQLQQMVAQEGALAAREGQALSSQAAQQGASYSALQQQMASAAQMRGASNLSDIARRGQENAAGIQSQYGPEIIKAKQAVHDTRATKGDARAQMIRQLIGEERDYMLSKGSLGVDKKQLGSSVDYAKENGRQQRRSARVSGRQSRKTVAAQQAGNAAQARLSGRQSRKTIGKQQRGYGGGGAGGGKHKTDAQKKSSRKKLASAMAELADAARNHTHWDSDRLRNYLVASQNVDPRYANKAIRKTKRKSRRKNDDSVNNGPHRPLGGGHH
jgi:hypothetical protein